MKISTELDLENRIAIVTIFTDEKSYTIRYELDKVVKQLDDLAGNWFARNVLDLLGFKVEVQKNK
jgi:hypothetical protein